MTLSPSGLSAQLGVAPEVTYGTIVTPTRFFEIPEGGESIKLDADRLESAGLKVGRRVQNSGRVVINVKGAGGDINFDVLSKDFGFWLKYCLGKVVTTQPAAGPAPTVYDHTGTIDDLSAAGSFTLQIGRPDVGGTVRAFTYAGCMITSWGLSVGVDGLLTLKISVDCQREDLATGLAVASYTAGSEVLSYVGGLVTLAGSAFDVKELSLEGSNPLAVDRRFIRQNTLKKQPIENGLREYSGSLGAEFESLTAYNRFVAGTTAALELLFEGSIIETTYKHTLKVTIPIVRFDGETPNVAGKEILDQPLPFKVLDDGTAEPITILYRTTGATP